MIERKFFDLNFAAPKKYSAQLKRRPLTHFESDFHAPPCKMTALTLPFQPCISRVVNLSTRRTGCA
jgi:hypothetical protein